MVVIIFYDFIRKNEIISDNFSDFKTIFGASADVSDPDLLIYEYTLDNKNFLPLNEENYMQFFIDSFKATVYVYSSEEEANYFIKRNEQIKIDNKIENKIENKRDIKTDNKTENEIDNKIENKIEKKIENKTENKKENKIEIKPESKSENKNEKNETINNNYGTNITEEMVRQRIIQNQREKMRLKKLKDEEDKKLIKEKDNEEKKKSENIGNNFENLISDAISKAINNPKFKEQLINESKIMCSKILIKNQNQSENEKKNDIELNQDNNNLEKHSGIFCSLCKKEIIGDRYLCVYCKNLNYCSRCEYKNGLEHGHPMFKLKFSVCD